MNGLIDSHTHLDMAQFDEDREAVFARSVAAGVESWIIPATTPDTARKMLEAPWRRPGLFIAAGIHPHEVPTLSEAHLSEVDDLVSNPEIVAVGEIGLDYHYGREHRDRQIQFFEAQLEIAQRHGRPVIVHIRDAYNDVLDILSRFKVTGVLHSFTGDASAAERGMELGYSFGVNGIITFKGSGDLREVIKTIPRDRILLETDAPYLAPIPFRGKRNEPAFIPSVLMTLSEMFGSDPEECLWITSNTCRLFGLPELSRASMVKG